MRFVVRWLSRFACHLAFDACCSLYVMCCGLLFDDRRACSLVVVRSVRFVVCCWLLVGRC